MRWSYVLVAGLATAITLYGTLQSRPAVYLDHVVIRNGDLSGRDLSNMRLVGASFDDCALGGASFQQSDLTNASMRNCSIIGADFRGASLRQADMRCAMLNGADLRGADLSSSRLEGTDLSGCCLAGVKLDGAAYNRYTSWPDGMNPQSFGAFLLPDDQCNCFHLTSHRSRRQKTPRPPRQLGDLRTSNPE